MGSASTDLEARPVAPPSPVARETRAEAIDSSRLIVSVHVASLVIGLGLLLFLTREQWFSQDDWAFVLRSLPGGEGVLEPHNGHWATVPIVVFRGLFAVFGLKRYAPYLVPVMVLQVVLAHVLWRLMRQMAISSWIATAMSAVFLVAGGMAEVLLLSMQMGFVGAVLLGVVTTMLANHVEPDRRRDLLAIVVAIVSLAFSGLSVTLIASAALVAWFRRGWRAATVLAAPSAAVYLLWLVVFGRDDLAGDDFGASDVVDVPNFVWSGLKTTIELATPLRAASALLVIALFVWLASQARRARTDAAPAFAMAIGAVLLYFVIASQRIAIFERTGTIPPRYAYVSWALLLPALALALHVLGRRTLVRRVLAVVVGALLMVNALVDLRSQYNAERAREYGVRTTMLGAAAFVAQEPHLRDVIVDHHSADGVTPVHLLELERLDDLPALPALTPAVRQAAAVRTRVRFARRPVPGLDTEATASVRSVRRAVVEPRSGDCVSVVPDGGRPVLGLAIDEQSTVELRSGAAGRLEVVLQDAGGSDGSASTSRFLRPGKPIEVQVVAHARPELVLPARGRSVVCNLDL